MGHLAPLKRAFEGEKCRVDNADYTPLSSRQPGFSRKPSGAAAPSHSLRAGRRRRSSFAKVWLLSGPVARATKFFEDRRMPSGTVKWFNTVKGFGFIQPDDGSKDVFVHVSAVDAAGLSGLREGQKLEYELVPDNRGRGAAGNLTAVD